MRQPVRYNWLIAGLAQLEERMNCNHQVAWFESGSWHHICFDCGTDEHWTRRFGRSSCTCEGTMKKNDRGGGNRRAGDGATVIGPPAAGRGRPKSTLYAPCGKFGTDDRELDLDIMHTF